MSSEGSHRKRIGKPVTRAAIIALLLAAVLVASRRAWTVGSAPLAAVPADQATTTAAVEKAAPAEPPAPMRLCERWETFTVRDGLPADKANCVKVDGDRIWVGTDGGLAVYEGGAWRAYRTEDGLAHAVVLGLDVSPATGDLWIATLGGLCRFSGGRFDCFNQMNSGLANDVVYGVACASADVWAATAAGASRYRPESRAWAIFNTDNTLMFEPWTYGVTASAEAIYLGVWGAGVVEYNLKTQRWRDYRDPDGEMELDLFKDDGLVHDVIPTVAYADGVLWAGSYFGLSRYDGRHWNTYFQDDSGLASDFINFVKARGPVVWICTDKGLSSFDGTTWVTYRAAAGGGELQITHGAQAVERRALPRTIAHNYVLGVDLKGDDVWVATSMGVSHGRGGPGVR
jgi:ligand-binding sensor domain-containing protein